MTVLDYPIPRQNWVREVNNLNGIAGEPGEKPVGASVREAGPWEAAVRKIIEFQVLGDDWDGLGAKAPSRELLESAIGLAFVLLDNGLAAPSRVVPGLEGDIIFEWQFPDGTYADVEIVRPFFAEVMVIEPGKPATHWTIPTH